LRHTAITQAAELGQRAGLGLDKIRAFSRHRTIATLMIYVDEHDREQTQRTLGELIATSLTSDASAQTPNV
jgi:integrase